MIVVQNKYTHVMTLFTCCMGDMVPQMYFKISHPLDPDTPNPEELPEVAQVCNNTTISPCC